MRKIISGTIPKNFFCKRCRRATNTIYKEGEETYCENCVVLQDDTSITIDDWRKNLNILKQEG